MCKKRNIRLLGNQAVTKTGNWSIFDQLGIKITKNSGFGSVFGHSQKFLVIFAAVVVVEVAVAGQADDWWGVEV